MSGNTGTINICRVDDVFIVSLLDEKLLNEKGSIQLEKNIKPLLLEKGRSVLVSFAMVKFLSSHAVAKIIRLQMNTIKHKSKMVLCDMRPEILEVFSTMQVDELFKIVKSKKEGIDFLTDKVIP